MQMSTREARTAASHAVANEINKGNAVLSRHLFHPVAVGMEERCVIELSN